MRRNWRWRLPVYTLLALAGYLVLFQPFILQLLADPVPDGLRVSVAGDPRHYRSAPSLPYLELKTECRPELADELNQRQKVFTAEDAALCEKWHELEKMILAAYPDLPPRPLAVTEKDRAVQFLLMPCRDLGKQLMILLDHHDFRKDRLGYLRLLSSLEGYRIQLAAQFGHRPSLLSVMFAAQVDNLVLRQVGRHLLNVTETPAGLRAIDAILAASGDRLEEYRRALRGEIDDGLEFSVGQLAAARAGRGFGEDPCVEWVARAWPDLISRELGTRMSLQKTEFNRILSGPIPSARRALRRYCTPVEASRWSRVSYLALLTRPAQSMATLLDFAGVQEFIPRSFDRIVERLTILQGTRTCIQVLNYRQRVGRLPATLAVLDRAYLDPMTNRPFGYRTAGDAFMLYGAGGNEQLDDGSGDDVRVWFPGR